MQNVNWQGMETSDVYVNPISSTRMDSVVSEDEEIFKAFIFNNYCHQIYVSINPLQINSHSELRGLLDTPCLPDDTCIQQRTECNVNRDLCVCQGGYYPKNGECGMLPIVYYLLKYKS